MSIPETQLDRWANKGASQGSTDTYTSIRAALTAYEWPEGMRHDLYLQGSYANDTNIRGNSDVDIICAMTSSIYSNLTEEQNRARGIGRGKHIFTEFRTEVERALCNYYGSGSVDFSGNKSLVVAAENTRLKADIVPCLEYHQYSGNNVCAEGIKFHGRNDGLDYLNFPKLHRENGRRKNAEDRTNGWYKHAVRMFKNARLVAHDRGLLNGQVPSHFVESLIYNAPDRCFGESLRETYMSCVNYLNNVLINDAGRRLVFQHEVWILLGEHYQQWSYADVRALLGAYVQLWQDWYG